MAVLEDIVERIDEAACAAAKHLMERVGVDRVDPTSQARQVQMLAVAVAMVARRYGVGEEQFVRVLRAAFRRVVLPVREGLS